ncbi:hypothetical protein TNCV_1160901 [Trichonephila clavipes]|nr:hypothetical protein TNCV_1160901 [Trichonephila clavipes]
MYGHMANWRGCPCFPKPPKGTALNNRNSYTNVYNSIIRPNVSYAQAANPNKISTNFNSQNKQPMAPKGPVNSAQIEANRNPSANNRSIPNFNNKSNNNFNGYNFNGNIFNNNNFNLQATLQMTMQCLCQLSQFTQAIATSNPNFMNNFNQVQRANNNPNQMYALLEASCNNNNELKPTSKKELKIYSNDTWNARLEALNTTDNSLWEAQRFLKNKRSQIPTLNCATGMAVTDPQKANLLANTIKNNFIENNRMQDNYDQDDEVVTSAVNTFFSLPPSTQIEPVMPDEIINFIKNTSSKKGPAVMRPILAYACPVWGYAAKTNINILNTLQNSYIRMIVNACRYMKNDRINKALKITSF